ncbi:hypothetical protein TrLO_g9330 [Triparma laevis f. longispina]|uniref:Uncharacterized protein n=1 Tax=Triparma laevis f. longispina TaxID=1714387 RepID=A0A9W6ZM65_9STRA|nr:hypothetical protein TrLO_g9330 [Triparma laevis f. longispina]
MLRSFQRLAKGPGTSSHTFLDRLNMTCTGGPGGRGSISFEHLPRSKRRPDGGNGAHGGSVFIRSNKKIQNLVRPTTPHLVAGAGGMGHGQKKHGKTGSNLIFQVPLGNDESLYDEKVIKTVADLNVDGSEVLVAEGGVGGMGNANYISLYGRDAAVQSKVSEAAVPSLDPQSHRIILELKTIADIGLLGLPNAGKSSLLSSLSKAKPTVDSYAFTTLSPTVGKIEFSDGFNIKMADIPGIVRGASEGRGRGLRFLRHVERTEGMCYVVDGENNPEYALEVIHRELVEYENGGLLDRGAMVVCNKMDLVEEDEEVVYRVEKKARELGIYGDVVGCSAMRGGGLEDVAEGVRRLCEESRGYQ